MNYQARIQKIIERMKEQNLDNILISDPGSIFYLTGKWMSPGERLLVLSLDKNGDSTLFNNELFPLQPMENINIRWYDDSKDAIQIIANELNSPQNIGVDKFWPAKFLLRLMEKLPDVKFVNGSDIVDAVRMQKDENERQKMRNASALNDQAIEKVIALVAQGNYTELEVAKKVEEVFRELGAEGNSFEPIIGYGANGADPHHEPDQSMLKAGDSIIIDMGCRKDSYCSDMTRTVFYKEANEKAKEVYHLVKEANEKAIAVVKPGVKFSDVDKAARNHIEQAGYGKYFTHRTGHSIGIDVHEHGDVSSINDEILQEGMIFSIEPGIYLTGELGVRIEDLVLVTKDGCEVLNKVSKELQIIG